MKSIALLIGLASLATIVSAIAAEPAPPATAPSTTPPAKAKEPTFVEKASAGLTATRQVVYKKAGDWELRLHIF